MRAWLADLLGAALALVVVELAREAREEALVVEPGRWEPWAVVPEELHQVLRDIHVLVHAGLVELFWDGAAGEWRVRLAPADKEGEE